MHDYTCQVCGAPASVIDSQVVRTCAHEGSTIIAERTAGLSGESMTGDGSLLQRARTAIESIFRAVKGVNAI